MLSYACSFATFYLPGSAEEETSLRPYKASSAPSLPIHSTEAFNPTSSVTALQRVLVEQDLYAILDIPNSRHLDPQLLRRSYLSLGKICHPDKYTESHKAEATAAFQKVSVAYDVLSKSSSRRMYDQQSRKDPSRNIFAVHKPAEDTFRDVVITTFNDFLDGDIEVVRSMLKTMNQMNPAFDLDEATIDSALLTLQSVRDRALTCRTSIYALHGELDRLLETQYALRQLSYFDIFGRTRLTLRLARITLTLPLTVDRAIEQQYLTDQASLSSSSVLPRNVKFMIRSLDAILQRLESAL